MQPILDELVCVTNELNNSYEGVRNTLHLKISALYDRIVAALNEAAHRFIPKQKHDGKALVGCRAGCIEAESYALQSYMGRER